MGKTITLHDPYRNIATTFARFARDEKARRMSVYLYFRRHGTLEGYRERPASGNGLRPHTYKYKGEYMAAGKIQKLASVSLATLSKYRKRGVVDVEEVRRLIDKAALERLHKVKLEDGSEMPCTQFARANGVTANSVRLWAARHGSMDGFEQRRPSRVNPAKFKDETGEVHTISEWATIFRCHRTTIRHYVSVHGSMAGFRAHRRRHFHKGNPRKLTLGGHTATILEWANKLHIPRASVNAYYHYHGSLEGIDSPRPRGRPRKLLCRMA